MHKIAINDKAPDFTFECTDPSVHSFQDLRGHNVVLYFYPKDNTPGCTQEGKDFTALHEEFAKHNTRIFGVSRDSLVCHERFSAKLGMPFALITDSDEKLCEYFDVLYKDNLLARLILKIERSTFLIDEKGVIRHLWRKVKVKGHAEDVLEAVRNL